MHQMSQINESIGKLYKKSVKKILFGYFYSKCKHSLGLNHTNKFLRAILVLYER